MGRYNIFKKEITQTEFRRLTITCYHLIIKQSDKQLSTSVRTSTLSLLCLDNMLLVSYNYQNKYISPVNIEKIVFF